MPQVIEQYDPWAGAGGAFGKGVGDQAPQEFDRYRLSQGLQNMKTQGQTPMQMAAQLYQASYDRPDIAQALLPYMMQGGQRNEQMAPENGATGGGAPVPGMGDQQGQPVINVDPGQPQQPGARATQGAQEAPKGIVTPQSAESLKTPIVPLGPDQLWSQAQQLSAQNPYTFPTPKDALPFVKNQDQERMQRLQGMREGAQQQQKLEADIQSGFDDRLSRKLQKDGKETYADVLGDIQNDLINRAMDDVRNGKLTPQQAIDKYTNQGLEMGKAVQNLRDIKATSFWDTSPHKSMNRLKEAQKVFDKLDRTGDFIDYLIAYEEFSAPYANELARPLSQNKQLESLMYSKQLRLGKLSVDQVAKEVSKHIRPNDSIYSIALRMPSAAQQEDFIDEIRALDQEGKISLSQPQQRELSLEYPKTKNSADIYYFGLGVPKRGY